MCMSESMTRNPFLAIGLVSYRMPTGRHCRYQRRRNVSAAW